MKKKVGVSGRGGEMYLGWIAFESGDRFFMIYLE